MQDLHVKLKPKLPRQKQNSLSIGLSFKEETSEVLDFGHGFVCCWNLDTKESGLEIPGKFCNVALKKDGEDQLDQLREKWISIT